VRAGAFSLVGTGLLSLRQKKTGLAAMLSNPVKIQMHMQDTQFHTMTPEQVAKRIGKKYTSLRKSMNRLGLDTGKYEHIPADDLQKLLQYEGTPDGRKDKNIVQAAQQLAESLDMQVSFVNADNASDSSTPSESKQKPLKSSSKRAKVKRTMNSKLQLFDALKFVFVLGLIGFQAWVWAGLAERVFNAINPEHTFNWFGLYIAGMLIESAGLMIAMGMNAGEEVEVFRNMRKVKVKKWKKRRTIWLICFLVFQVAIDASYLGLFGTALSDHIGQWLIAVSIPAGIFGYTDLYLNRDNH
jgi:hypothetical protein